MAKIRFTPRAGQKPNLVLRETRGRKFKRRAIILGMLLALSVIGNAVLAYVITQK